jgi:hypothetical protein
MKCVEKEKDICYSDLLQNMQKHFDQKAMKIRQDFEQWRLEMIQRSNKEIKMMHEELEEQLKVEVQQAEQEMHTKTQSQIDLSGLSLHNIATQYKTSIRNNIDPQKTLKSQVMEAQKDKQEESIQLALVKREHARRAEPMEKFQMEVCQLTRQVAADQVERKELVVLKTELSHLNTTFQGLKWKHELLLQSLQLAKKERDECKSKFLSNIYESQQQNELHNLFLENTFRSLIERGERQTATLIDQISKLDGKLGRAKQIKEILERVGRQAELAKIMPAGPAEWEE